jgi:hypothetical protein
MKGRLDRVVGRERYDARRTGSVHVLVGVGGGVWNVVVFWLG